MDCKKVSVIVPVYKVEAYLVQCLDSLCRQTLQDIEIILVDDASPDRCGEICEAYAEKDTRFKVIHHPENSGLGAARNTGIAHATCDYLMFVDSDDVVNEDFCRLPYECACRYCSDLVMFGYEVNRLKGLKIKKIVPAGYKTRYEAVELTFSGYGMVAWNKLYSKRLFNGIIYPEGILYEDTATTYKLIWRASCIYCINDVLYYHCLRWGSLSERRETLKMIRDRFAVQWQQCKELYAWGYKSEKLDLYKMNVALAYCIGKSMDLTDLCYCMAAQYLQQTVRIPKKLTRKRKLLVKLFKFSPKMFSFVCKIWGKQII